MSRFCKKNSVKSQWKAYSWMTPKKPIWTHPSLQLCTTNSEQLKITLQKLQKIYDTLNKFHYPHQNFQSTKKNIFRWQKLRYKINLQLKLFLLLFCNFLLFKKAMKNFSLFFYGLPCLFSAHQNFSRLWLDNGRDVRWRKYLWR